LSVYPIPARARRHRPFRVKFLCQPPAHVFSGTLGGSDGTPG